MHAFTKHVKRLALLLLLAPSPCAAGEPLEVVFFFTPGCRMCAEARKAVLEAEQRFGDAIAVERVDLSDSATGPSSVRRLFEMLDQHGVGDTPELAVFAGGSCLAGGEAIVAGLDAAIHNELAQGQLSSAAKPDVLNGRSSRTGFWAISAAAAADGVNPCAFATIVLLVSMMATARRTRGETLLIGGAFTAAVFATYFVIGLSLYSVLHQMASLHLLSDLVFLAAFGACVVFATLSLWDAVLAWRGRDAAEMKLKLPEAFRSAIAKRLSRGVRSASLVGGVFAAGVVVSLLEAACTGQVYFPVIAGMVRDDATRGRGMALLLWYNVVFVAPLVLVLTISVAGVSSERIAAWGRRHWGLSKVALCIVFVSMAFWMMPGLAWPPGAR